MTSGFKTLAFSGLGVLGAGAISTGGYSIWNNANPTGSARLWSSGYAFNPPQFTKYENLDHGCSDTIFKEDSGFEQGKLYGCGVASISIYDSGDQFKDKSKTVDYLTFNSEISMRKGSEGWKINTRFDNRSDTAAVHSHYVTTYTKENNEGWKESDTFYIPITIANPETADFEIDKNGSKYEIYTGQRELNIKVPVESWYKSKNYLFSYDSKNNSEPSASRSDLRETFKEKKFWSGIWVEETSRSSSWIFQDIEVFLENKKYSKFFCKNENAQTNDCWQDKTELGKTTNTYTKEGTTPASGEEGTWSLASNIHTKSENNETVDTDEDGEDEDQDDSGSGESQLSKKVKPIIDKFKDSKGKWVDTKSFCNYGYERNIDEKQLKDLRMFCSTKKK